MKPARGEIGLDQRAVGRHCGPPDGKRRLGALGIVAIRLRLRVNAADVKRVTHGAGVVSSHRPRDRSAAMTCSWSQPAWQRTSTLPSSASRIDRLGLRSSWAGQRAIQPPPALRRRAPWRWSQRSWRASSSSEATDLPASFAGVDISTRARSVDGVNGNSRSTSIASNSARSIEYRREWRLAQQRCRVLAAVILEASSPFPFGEGRD